METYGKFESEQIADENQICRKIVSEITNYGISQRQTLFIIYLLALELENNESMQAITKLIKNIESGIFLTDRSLEQEQSMILQGD